MWTPDLCFGFVGGLLAALLIFVIVYTASYLWGKDK